MNLNRVTGTICAQIRIEVVTAVGVYHTSGSSSSSHLAGTIVVISSRGDLSTWLFSSHLFPHVLADRELQKRGDKACCALFITLLVFETELYRKR